MPTEADTCRTLILPRLYAAGWTDDQLAEQRTFTDGRIVVHGQRARRRPGNRVENGGQSGSDSTNDHAIVEFYFTTGRETQLTAFPSPTNLWCRLHRTRGGRGSSRTYDLIGFPFREKKQLSPPISADAEAR